ncbi:hypothetical protein MKW98_026134 [Papaver atlanticum]|uniref:NERD domain-containing protein n=1 Tax=Papaver atlanticum TaxID=357466 RepID=A0AAD4RY44_9MAGN|nr:hypothetical protein MKW98_026134 [Papaver atlanticum]
MWLKVVCLLLIYSIFRRFLYDDSVLEAERNDTNAEFPIVAGIYRRFRRFLDDDDDDILEDETNDTDAKFLVGERAEKVYGGKLYLGLRIPDHDTGSRQNIDMVVVTKEKVMVNHVKNFSGHVKIDSDGSWICAGGEKQPKVENHPNPVVEAKRQVEVLESYFEQRGVELPNGYVTYRVVLSNPSCRALPFIDFPPEVVPFDQLITPQPEAKGVFTGWNCQIKDAFRGGKKEEQDRINRFNQQLHFVLSTAPMWDRLELEGNKHLLGEFLRFEGKDVLALRQIKRSKVSRLVIQKSSMFGFGCSEFQVLYSARDYRSQGASGFKWKEVTVKSSIEVLFQQQNSTKVRKFKLSSIISMALTA